MPVELYTAVCLSALMDITSSEVSVSCCCDWQRLDDNESKYKKKNLPRCVDLAQVTKLQWPANLHTGMSTFCVRQFSSRLILRWSQM